MSTSSVVQSPELIEIVSQPALYVESVMRYVKGDRFAICDADGNILGYREKGSGAKVFKSSHPLAVLVDLSGTRLLTIHRPWSLTYSRSRFEVFVPDEKGGKDILVGGGQMVTLQLDSRYDLYEQNNRDHPFARIRIARKALSNPIEADSGAVIASIHRQTVYKERPRPNETTSRSSTYGIIMDPSAGMDPDRKADSSLTLEQRTVLLAMSIVMDIDEYTKDETDDPIKFGGENMFGASMDVGPI